jgi:hypothetical protein
MFKIGLLRLCRFVSTELPSSFRLVTPEGLRETTLEEASRLLKEGEILKLVNPKEQIVRISSTIKKKINVQKSTRKEKEIELNSTIDPHDLEIKMKQISLWLEKKYVVKVSMVPTRRIAVDGIYKQLQTIHASFTKLTRAGRKINFIMEYKKP